MSGYGPAKWKDNNQLWWTGKPGAKMKLAVNVKNEGDFEFYTTSDKSA